LTPAEAARMRSLSRFFRENGILLPADAAACLSTPMTDGEIDSVSSAFEMFLKTSDGGKEEAQQ
jgi:glutamate-1-semialdehyde 2,1-aminomutase